MRKSVDFSEGQRGKHAGMDLKVGGAAETNWAVCIEESNRDLIQFKLYRVESYGNSPEVRVVNEAGEKSFYPKEWFETLDVPEKTLDLLKRAA